MPTTLPATVEPIALPDRSGHDPRLGTVREKVLRGERLTLAEGELLYTTPDVWGVLALADLVRRRLHGDVAYYNINRHLNYSNVCALSCKFCEFYRKKDEPGAYTRDEAYIRAEARKAIENGATEMHIVGGLQPYLPFEYYTDMLRAIREEATQLHLKAFTAVEIVHLAKIARAYKRDDRRAGIRDVLARLKDAGLGSLPGGGAEVFDDRVHDEAFKGKIRSDEWLDVHLVAHELGLNSNATILYGHIDARRERLVHMEILRRAQDRALARLGYEGQPVTPELIARGVVEANLPATREIDAPVITLTREGVSQPTPALAHKGGYFQTIIPLPFFPDGSDLEHLPGPTALENLRTLAVARLMLDNFPHAKAFWIMQTLPMAQLMLQSGADDIDGTVVWYDITHVAGASTHQETSVWTLQKAIREAGLTPVERDTLYRRVERDGKAWKVVG
ncbi:MAG: radical SAM protein [Phycisphaerales bacterium]|jgi:aminodeoxyfutalosine synthase|nr:radical SAM protein [Phycisphaerales bacterium]